MSWPTKNLVMLRTSAATLWSDPILPENVQKTIAGDAARFIRAAAARPLKISRETLVLQTELRLASGPLAWSSSNSARAGFGRRWRHGFARHGPRNWANAEFLLAHEIATPRPYLACRGNGLWSRRQLPGERMDRRKREPASFRLADRGAAGRRAAVRGDCVRRADSAVSSGGCTPPARPTAT